MRIVRKTLILGRIVAVILFLILLPCVTLADDCSHTNADRSTIETYESIAGNNSTHELVCWMQTICLDCLDLSEVKLFSQEEPHQFETSGSVLTCKWCEYQTTEEALQATPVPTETPAPTLLNEEYTWGDYKYKLYSNGDAEISKGTVRGAVTIPEKIDGHRVVSIASQAFYDCHDLTNIIIPESVTSIGHQAFGFCFRLTEITIPNSVTSIADFAFRYCEELTSITIPASVTTLGKNPFWNCYKLTNIQVASSHPTLEVIDGALVDKEEKLLICYPAGSTAAEYRIPEGILTIGEYAFYSCSTLIEVEIPETVTSIEESAFEKCHALRSVSVPESVISIGDRAFFDCSMLTITCNEQIASRWGALTPVERFADYANVWKDTVQSKLPKGQKIKVYTGPDRACPVAVNGTARLNTNDSFEVWGYRVHWNTKEKWYLVRYKTNNNGGIGYINENDFSGSIDCAELPFTRVWSLPYDTVLITDDPDGGQRTLIAISNNQPYTNYLATYKGKTGDWYYVEYDEYDPPVYGFIPAYTIERLTGW